MIMSKNFTIGARYIRDVAYAYAYGGFVYTPKNLKMCQNWDGSHNLTESDKYSIAVFQILSHLIRSPNKQNIVL